MGHPVDVNCTYFYVTLLLVVVVAVVFVYKNFKSRCIKLSLQSSNVWKAWTVALDPLSYSQYRGGSQEILQVAN